MANPNHKAALAVVVGSSDNQGQPRGKVKQNAFSSPRKPSSQKVTMNGIAHSQGAQASPQYSHGFSSPSLPNSTTSANPPNGYQPQHLTIDQRLQHPNGNGHRQTTELKIRESQGRPNDWFKGGGSSQPRLLGVEEALQYSPFSSIVPFGSGMECARCSQIPLLTPQILYLPQMPTFLVPNPFSQQHSSSAWHEHI